tara:strand:- start:7246 stop:7527 length:282 start_codon:yes stop_codon:yes gene_type:complete
MRYLSNMSEQKQQAVEISPDSISKEALDSIIESFILREGTDYGFQEVSLDTKKRQIHKQLEKQEIVLVYDLENASPQLLSRKEWTKLQQPITD